MGVYLLYLLFTRKTILWRKYVPSKNIPRIKFLDPLGVHNSILPRSIVFSNIEYSYTSIFTRRICWYTLWHYNLMYKYLTDYLIINFLYTLNNYYCLIKFLYWPNLTFVKEQLFKYHIKSRQKYFYYIRVQFEIVNTKRKSIVRFV